MALPLGRNKVLGQINKVEGQIWPSGLVFATCGVESEGVSNLSSEEPTPKV